MDDSNNRRFDSEEHLNCEDNRAWVPNQISVRNGDDLKYQIDHHQPLGCNYLSTQHHQPSQPDQVAQNQTDRPSQVSGQTTGRKKPRSDTPEARRSAENREKQKNYMIALGDTVETLTAEKTYLMDQIGRLDLEKTNLMDQIGKLNLEKMEWKEEKKELTANMTAITGNIEKLAAQCEALSQSINSRQPDEQTDRQSEFQKIHLQLETVQANVMEVKRVVLASSKQSIEDLEGSRRLNEQIPEQNRLSNITRKVVLQLDVREEKDKQKVMEVVSGLSGVDSISIDMKDKKLTVIGGVDPINVVIKLREQWETEILTVVPVREEKKGGAKER